ncbi:MAG: response regulator [Bryobacteraceae bacterium]
MADTSAPPRTERQDEQTAPERDSAHGPGNGKPRILIVDDSLTVRMDLRQTFDTAEFDIVACETLAAARAEIARQAPSLVILDVLLPDGDGVDLLREIKATMAPAPLVMLLSTEAEVSDRVRGLKTGADDYIGKPYDATYVLARVRELIGVAACLPKPAAPRLVLIDDSATSRRHFQSILESAGYSVVTAENGEEGLRTAFALRPDAIIVDHFLAGGIDGDTVIRRLKQDVTLRNTPCLLFTASAKDGEELRMLDAGADAFLGKEVEVDVLLARLAALIRSGNPALAVDASPSSLLGAKKVLAVDDSITYLAEVSAQLRKEGYDVVQAHSGKEALDLLEVQIVDCILLDVLMPGLSGNETCRIIKKRPSLRGIPLLMLTAAEGHEALIEGIESGADDYIGKSSDFTVLKARLRAQLRRKQSEDELRLIREELLRKDLDAAQARADREIAQARAVLVDELEAKNRELEAFSYAVSHDLRAPLRAIDGFSDALISQYRDLLDDKGKHYLRRIHEGSLRMGQLIEDLLDLSRITRRALSRERVNLSDLALEIASELRAEHPQRQVEFAIAPDLAAVGDRHLLRIALQNLAANAWKFTGKCQCARIEFGVRQQDGERVYFVRDNGVGFDMAYADKLFTPFQRLHGAQEFPGTGIGLATVQRIVIRHGGRVWAEAAVGKGATFSFTLREA